MKIPVGACGRDTAETEATVRFRCREALGESGDALFDCATAEGSSVTELAQWAESAETERARALEARKR